MLNPITLIDGYKVDHRRQYPPKTTRVYSNWTPRSSRIPDQDHVVFFGLQYFLQKYLMEEANKFFGEKKQKVIDNYNRRINNYFGPNNIGTEHIEHLWEQNCFPLEFCAVPEGSLVPLRVPMFTVENTDPDFFWLVNYIETLLSSTIWLPCTSATTAYRFRKLLNNYAAVTGTPKEFVRIQGHDFSFRGLPGVEAAAMSGAAHLLSFTGTDTIPALDFLEDYYGADGTIETLGNSVPATEHSVMCAGGFETELETFNRLLDLYPSGVVSVVSDTWDLWNVCTNILPQLKEKVLARDGKLVIRPDSGNPADILCGDPSVVYGDPVERGVIELLWEVFGGKLNKDGYRVLDPHIGVIYGDAITYDRAKEICNRLLKKGFSTENIVFGVGSFTYQYTTRDTYGFAMKATWAEVGGKAKNLFKKPVTDTGEKFSATGRLAVFPYGKDSMTVREKATPEEEEKSLLQPVWKDGHFFNRTNLTEIRRTLWGEEF